MVTPLTFYDLKTGENFVSSNYIFDISSKGMLIAKTIAPSGVMTIKMIKRA